MVEIERKWILKDIPDIKLYEKLKIKQYYLPSKHTTRIRKITSDSLQTYTYTEKKHHQLAYGKIENEYDISKSKFEKLKKLHNYSIKKIRYTKNINGICYCVDVFENLNLIILEAEIISNENNYLSNLNYLNELILPKKLNICVSKEITYDKRYSNKKIAKRNSKKKIKLFNNAILNIETNHLHI